MINTKKLLSSMSMEIPALEANAEGTLKGGFYAFPCNSAEATGSNPNCNCGCGPDGKNENRSNPNCNCGCGPDGKEENRSNHNCNCGCNGKKNRKKDGIMLF